MKGKSVIIVCLLLAFVASLNAQTFESNGIKYNVYGDGKVEVKGSLKKVLSIPSTVTYRAQKYTVERIGCDAFKGSDLEQIILPATLKTIESAAFWDTKNLKRIKIPEGVEVIGNSAFRDSGIRQIMLPSTLKRIEMWAFSGSALERIELPNTLKEIEQTVFMETRNLKSIIIPEGVEKIGTGAFVFSGLEQIQLPTTFERNKRICFSRNAKS